MDFIGEVQQCPCSNCLHRNNKLLSFSDTHQLMFIVLKYNNLAVVLAKITNVVWGQVPCLEMEGFCHLKFILSLHTV